MPVSENKLLSLAFLITLILHVGLIGPLSQWLDRTLIPQFTGESLEVDINEIRSNLSPAKKPDPPTTPKKKPLPEVPPEPKREPVVPLPEPLLTEKEEFRLVPKEKKTLAFQAADEPDLKVDTEPLPAPPEAAKPATPPEQTLEEQVPAESNDVLRDTPDELVLRDLPAEEPQRLPLRDLPAEEPQRSPLRDLPAEEPQRSPLFIKKEKLPEALEEETSSETVPDEISGSFRQGKPEETRSEDLQYSMNTYQWTFERFIDNWVVDIQKWWKAPIDYLTGKMPDGGDLWVQVHLNPSGKLLSYKVVRSGVTPEMELRAIQALIGSLKRPQLPPSFEEKSLVINWRFIYPPLRPPIRMRR